MFADDDIEEDEEVTDLEQEEDENLVHEDENITDELSVRNNDVNQV